MKDAVWLMSPEDRLCVPGSCFIAVAVINVMLTPAVGNQIAPKLHTIVRSVFPFSPACTITTHSANEIIAVCPGSMKVLVKTARIEGKIVLPRTRLLITRRLYSWRSRTKSAPFQRPGSMLVDWLEAN